MISFYLQTFFWSHSKCFALDYVLQFLIALLAHMIRALEELSILRLSGPQGKIMEKLLPLFSTSHQTSYQQFMEDQENCFLLFPNSSLSWVYFSWHFQSILYLWFIMVIRIIRVVEKEMLRSLFLGILCGLLEVGWKRPQLTVMS